MTTQKRGSRRRPPSGGGSHQFGALTWRHWVRRIAGVTALVLAGFGGIWTGLHDSPEPPSPGPDQRGELSGAGPEVPRRPAPPLAKPASLDIPSVGIHTRLLELGLNPDGTLEVPSRPMLAGWYAGSPSPGARGPAIISGHVDSAETGPAVFYRLGDVALGDRIDVTRKDGSMVRFQVTAVRAFAKKDFPTRAVYGNTTQAALRLITCGSWNDTTREYDGNVVVFAEREVADS